MVFLAHVTLICCPPISLPCFSPFFALTLFLSLSVGFTKATQRDDAYPVTTRRVSQKGRSRLTESPCCSAAQGLGKSLKKLAGIDSVECDSHNRIQTRTCASNHEKGHTTCGGWKIVRSVSCWQSSMASEIRRFSYTWSPTKQNKTISYFREVTTLLWRSKMFTQTNQSTRRPWKTQKNCILH